MDDLDQLCRLAGNDGTPQEWNAYFDPIGLILYVPPKCGGYWCTPVNSLTFAATGCDGTHYGLLCLPERRRDEQPVVMTVPMSDGANVVVGETLREFLALGCRVGYRNLEGLVYQRDETLATLERDEYDSEDSPDEIAMLRTLAATFGLRPWPNPKARLAELRLRYFSKLTLPPSEAV